MTSMSRPRPAAKKEIEQEAIDEENLRRRDGIPFVAESGIVKKGMFFVARARSRTMAKRIANALNAYTPNERGE